jgi:hypothetical protein
MLMLKNISRPCKGVEAMLYATKVRLLLGVKNMVRLQMLSGNWHI